MTISEARLLCALRQSRWSLRAIAEAWYSPDSPFHGNQGEGEELLREATALLGREPQEHYDDFIEKWERTGASKNGD